MGVQSCLFSSLCLLSASLIQALFLSSRVMTVLKTDKNLCPYKVDILVGNSKLLNSEGWVVTGNVRICVCLL